MYRIVRHHAGRIARFLAGSALVASAASGTHAVAAEGFGRVADTANYLRVKDLDDGSGVALEISTRTLRPVSGKGPEIKLVGVAHIASTEFFAQRQALLDAQPLVLYEGVGPTWYEVPADADDARRARVSVDRIRHIGTVIEQQKADLGTYPADLTQVLAGVNGYDKRLVAIGLFDGWLRPLGYEVKPDGKSFELVSFGADGKPGGEGLAGDLRLADQPPLAPAEMSSVRGIQGVLADATGLAFQLESMDYVRGNWRNADMTVDQLMAAMAQTEDGGGMGAMMLGLGAGDGDGNPGMMPDLEALRGLLPEGVDAGMLERLFGLDPVGGDENGTENTQPDGNAKAPVTAEREVTPEELSQTADEAENLNDQFMQLMGGQGDMMDMIAPVLDMITQSPMMRSAMKLMMIEMLGRSESLMGGMGGPGGPMGGFMDVILHQRNAVVIDELREVLDKGTDAESIALFYGAAHLEGLEESLINDMGYEVVATDWAPAISFAYAEMGMPPAQGRMIRQMLSQQMEQMLQQFAPQDAGN